MGFMQEAAERLMQEWEEFDPQVPYQEPMCLYAVSKNMHGDFHLVQHDHQQCPGTECETMKNFIRVEGEMTSNAPCDSPQGQQLDGPFRGEMVNAHIVDGDGRGSHGIKVEWQAGNNQVLGLLAGISNAGTHRPPISTCERCDEHGHIEGRLRSVVVDGEHRGCFVLGSYTIEYDASSTGQDTSLSGTFEGVLACACE